MCVCVSLCTTVVHNTAQNSSDNLPSYPPDNHHSSDVLLDERKPRDEDQEKYFFNQKSKEIHFKMQFSDKISRQSNYF